MLLSRSVHEQIADQVESAPSRIAVIHAGGAVTYRELWDRTSEIARSLLGMGVGPGMCVGVCLDRGLAGSLNLRCVDSVYGTLD